MDDLSQAALSPALGVACGLLIAASIAVWGWAAVRLGRGPPVLPYEPRRRVPWRAADVLLVFLLFELPAVIALALGILLGSDFAEPPTARTAEQVDVEHPIVDLLGADPSLTTWLLCGLVAVVIAPVVEEFMYRLVLQGWLEAGERRARRRLALLRPLARGVGPVLFVSLLFALRHFRRDEPSMEADQIKQVLVFQAVWSLLAFGFALGLLRIRSGATAADLGFVREKLLGDVRLGLLVFSAVTAPVLVLQYALTRIELSQHFAADPIPLFFFALALGAIYYRTHRIVPAIVTHMAFNATNLALAWLQL